MAQAAVPLMILSTGASVAMSAENSSAQARAIDNESKRAASDEKTRANEETIARKERLLQSLSSQAANAGASGAGLAGSALHTMNVDIDEANKEQTRADLGSRIRRSGIRAGGKSGASAARRSGNLGAAQSLISLGAGLSATGGTGVE